MVFPLHPCGFEVVNKEDTALRELKLSEEPAIVATPHSFKSVFPSLPETRRTWYKPGSTEEDSCSRMIEVVVPVAHCASRGMAETACGPVMIKSLPSAAMELQRIGFLKTSSIKAGLQTTEYTIHGGRL